MKLPKRIRTMPLEEFQSSLFCGSVTKVPLLAQCIIIELFFPINVGETERIEAAGGDAARHPKAT